MLQKLACAITSLLGLSTRQKVAGAFFGDLLPTGLIVCFNACMFAGNVVADRCAAKGGGDGGKRRVLYASYVGMAVEGGCAALAVVLAFQAGGGDLLLLGLYGTIAFITGGQSVLHSSAAQEACAEHDVELSSVAGTAMWVFFFTIIII